MLFAPEKIVPYAGFEQVILAVQSQHMEHFFSERIWTEFGHGSLDCFLFF